MRKNSILLLLLFISFSAQCQDFSGFWVWEEPGKSFNIEIQQESSDKFTGSHTGVFGDGNRIDTSLDENSITLHRVSTNLFEGTITSFYSLNTYKVRITFDPINQSIEWALYGEITGTFYFPRKVNMVRLGSDNRLTGHWDSMDDAIWTSN